MSHQEIDRIGIVESIESKSLSQAEGAKQLNISSRQMRRLQTRYRQEGVEGLISKHRGKPSNNQISKAVKSEVCKLIREKYRDFGPTLAQEKLVEQHNKKLSIESVRQMMIADELWMPKQRKTKRVFQLRPRRERFGELIQIDGSPHDWFEGRGDSCTLIVFIDDASSRLTSLQFFPTETTKAYMAVLKNHMACYGRPVSLYSDRHGIFRVNQKEAKSGDGHTQFSRALDTLGIESIQAQTPQAKGRVERANKTLQDRLVKEMRLKGINTLDEANAFLPEFISDFNQRFGKPAKNKEDAHRKVLHTEREVDLILSRQSKRKVSNALEISYKNTIYQIQGNRHRLKQQQITVCDLFGKEIVLLYEGEEVAYKRFNESKPSQSPEDEKTLNKRVDQAMERQSRPTHKPAADHPWRRSAPAH
jgi:transposase